MIRIILDELRTDVTYFKIVGWGWYYLYAAMDDCSGMILSWRLYPTMRAEDVKESLDRAIQLTGVHDTRIDGRLRLISDIGSYNISKSRQDFLKEHDMGYARGKSSTSTVAT